MSEEITPAMIGDVLTSLVARIDSELLALEAAELAAQWYWRWENGKSIEWNTYKFSDALEMHKRRCRRWEEYHNGHCCVVERVRDKYVMPRVREFLTALATHNAELRGRRRRSRLREVLDHNQLEREDDKPPRNTDAPEGQERAPLHLLRRPDLGG